MEERVAGSDELRLHLLVLRCQAGDEEAFARLYDSFCTRTLRYLRGLLGEEAEDVQQEVWLTVYRSIRGLTNPRAFRTWLFSTTRHRAIDHLRRQRRETEAMEEAAVELNDMAESAIDASVDGLNAGMLDELMAGLPVAQREVLLLRFQDGMSYAETALVVGCSIGTVRSRLHHAKRRVQQRMEQRTSDTTPT